MPLLVSPNAPSKTGAGSSIPAIPRNSAALVLTSKFPTQVPAVDGDGNDIPGVRAPMVQAPLASYTGWSLRQRNFGHGAMFEFDGSTIAFANTASERQMTGDPRLSVEERYADREAYIMAIESAARALVAQGFMLEEDVARCAQSAADWGAPRHDVSLA